MNENSRAEKPRIRDEDTADSGVRATSKPAETELGSEGEATRDAWKPNRVRERDDDRA